jgi:hypothetical protein
MTREIEHFLQRVRSGKEGFVEKCKENGFKGKCNKLTGALVIELIRESFEKHGIRCSPRDVFIEGVPVEIDLLLIEKDAKPKSDLLYQPGDVVAALEIKALGCFGKAAVTSVKTNFEMIHRANDKIMCAYVNLADLEGYKWRVTMDNPNLAHLRPFGFDPYNLSWHKKTGKSQIDVPSGDWEDLIKNLRSFSHSA